MEKAITAADVETLAPAMGADAEQIAAEVSAGISQLIRYADGSRIVARVEYDATGGELVIVAGAGRDAPGKVAALVEQAERRGWTVRFHTKRPALGRMLARLGFTESERVYRYGRK
jgi:hypothetical protein